MTPEVSTRAWLEISRGDLPQTHGGIQFYNPRDGLNAVIRTIYPDGLRARTVLDCACNNGAYLFYLKGLGAGECFGFDVREHWIAQANWLLQRCTTVPTEGMRFEVCDLYELPRRRLQPFDISLFNGIFYHLPDPVAGLKVAADLTREVMVVNTATYSHAEDGFLAVDEESTDHLMSGVYGLNWRPTGPVVMDRILRSAGFRETFVAWWVKESGPPNPPGWGRLIMVASKVPGLLDGFRRWQTTGAELERYRAELTAYCTLMLGAPLGSDDPVQDTLVRAWRGRGDFDGRTAMRTWVYRIATGVCLDRLRARELAGTSARQDGSRPDPRAVLVLRDALHWKAADVAEVLETTVAAVNTALRQARAAGAGGMGRPVESDQ